MKHSFKDFIPLISIVVAVIVFTTAASIGESTNSWMRIMELFMAGFFLIFGTFKIVNLTGFVMAFQKYDVIAMKSKLYATIYPFIEIALGIAYFYSWKPTTTNVVTLIIMLVGAYGVWKKLRQREEVPCACLGAVFKLPMTKVTLFEDLLMAAMAASMLLY